MWRTDSTWETDPSLDFCIKNRPFEGWGEKNRPFVPINFASKLDFCISLPGFTQFQPWLSADS